MGARKLVAVSAVTDHRRLPYQPALDGLRGVAVAAVLLFHLGYSWAKGGYLGVSVFFTLSGYLITTLLLTERGRTGRTELRRFWSRRARRLLPAALCGLVLAALVSRSLPIAPEGVRVDLLAALVNVANWRFLLAGRSYADLFSSPSPTLHFWSLAIEEQFYLFFPLAFALVARRPRTPRALLRACIAGIVVSWAALAAAGVLGAHDFAYYSTITRAGELLVGAAAALLVARTRHRRSGQAPRSRQVLEVGALAALAVLCSQVAESSSSLERGVLPLVAMLTAIVVVGACHPGPVARALSWRPLVGLGRISYGVYVYHWPLLLWLTPARTGLDGLALSAVRVVATLAVAGLSFVLIERPVRTGRWPRPVVAIRIAPVGLAATALLILLVAPTAKPVIDFAAAQDSLRPSAAPRAAAAVAAPAAPPTAALMSNPPRAAIFGDSTALMTGLGLGSWARDTGRMQLLFGDTPLGCSVARGGDRRFQGGEGPTNAQCDTWEVRWPQELAQNPVDIAIVQEGPWEVADRKIPGDDRWRHLGDPTLDSYVRNEMLAAVDLLLRHAKVVVWLTSPDIRADVTMPIAPTQPLPENDARRMARYNELVREVAAARPNVHVVDLSAYLASLPGGELDPQLRPDGIHFSNDTTHTVAPWIAEQVLAAATGR
jgi:peptidoglycan/LPS O-acetylase OafA/YrhL